MFRHSKSTWFLIGCALLALYSKSVTAQTTQLPGVAELKKGDYENAIKLFNSRLVSSPSDQNAEAGLVRALIETGRYLEAENSAKKYLLKNADAGLVHHELAEVLAVTGRYTEAIAEFERALQATKATEDKLQSELRRAELLELTGQEDRAKPIYESFVSYYTEKNPQDAPSLTWIARALVHLERFQDANDLYRSALEADSSFLEAQLSAAELYTQKYNYSDATQFLDDALQINQKSARAHLDVALNKALEGGELMSAELARALEINPNFVEALTCKGGVELEAGHFEAATSHIEKALRINPRSLDAHSQAASALYLQDRDYAGEITTALQISPHYGKIYDTLAHFATNTRRTDQAAGFARKAIGLSPRLWNAHLTLGMSLLRMGQMEEGRAEVEKAFKGDPFNLWAKNTLDLLDTMQDFKETKSGVFLIKASARESDVLSNYAAELLQEASTKLIAKYHFTPKGPITIELFPNHEDFAVRTLGIPGLGALGVCFGQVIAQDSPSARGTGEFNWGSTLWHEYTHVITLQMTDYRIPRWFSEGLSVYEERRARPGWGDDWNPMFVRALVAGRWFKIADLDAGFQRPRSPTDVPIAYFEASQICEFIAERFGFDAILKMLALYRDKANTSDILRQVLKLSDSEFDREFSAWIESKTRPLAAALRTEANVVASLSKDEVLKMLATEDTFALHVRAGELLAADGNVDDAIKHFRRAIELFPYYTEQGNPYPSVAKLLEQKGDLAQAADAWEALAKQDENNLDALKAVTRLRLSLSDRSRGLEALRLSFYVSPFDYALHARAGDLSMESKDYAQALNEFKVTLALQPPNIAEANYNIANAYHLMGQQLDAKRAVLRALEAAPRYEKAQELLLQIVGQ
ncbi:MAG: hypothetical protein C5B55_00475 [Blastocatellia bacterium]|nr:MAG: hypothetical protein C5B55_00475 [Blastocatellia bacterium]